MRGLLLTTLLATAWVVSGCAPLIIAGGATAVAVAHDRRTTGALVDDQLIEMKAAAAIAGDHELNDKTHVNVTSVNGIVLLTGETPTTEMRDRVLAAVRAVPGVRRTVDDLRIAEPSAFRDRSDDTWITSKVKTKLVGVKDLDSTQVKVVTEHHVVYLMGLVYRKEADLATEATRDVSGVERVVKLFEYLD
jgi:osmotically-inducible protein OsmY